MTDSVAQNLKGLEADPFLEILTEKRTTGKRSDNTVREGSQLVFVVLRLAAGIVAFIRDGTRSNGSYMDGHRLPAVVDDLILASITVFMISTRQRSHYRYLKNIYTINITKNSFLPQKCHEYAG